jgi:hypothetical protein
VLFLLLRELEYLECLQVDDRFKMRRKAILVICPVIVSDDPSPDAYVVGCTRYAMSLISAITSKGRMRFMVKKKGGVNAHVFIEFLKRLLVGETLKIFLVVDRGPAHRAKKTKAFVETLAGG